MELATLAALAPGTGDRRHRPRRAGLDGPDGRPPGASAWPRWRRRSAAVRRLLGGEEVDRRRAPACTLDRACASTAAPTRCPPVLAGVRGPRSLAAAGAVRRRRGARRAQRTDRGARRDRRGRLTTGRSTWRCTRRSASIATGARRAPRRSPPFIVEMVGRALAGPAPRAVLRRARATSSTRRRADGVVDMPDDWWTELTGAGTIDDVLAHLAVLEAAGAQHVAFFPAPEPDIALAQLERRDRRRRRHRGRRSAGELERAEERGDRPRRRP